MEMDLVEGGAVDSRLSLGDRLENSQCELFLAGEQPAPFDDLVDVGEMAVGVLFGMGDAQVQSTEGTPHDRNKLEPDTGESE